VSALQPPLLQGRGPLPLGPAPLPALGVVAGGAGPTVGRRGGGEGRCRGDRERLCAGEEAGHASTPGGGASAPGTRSAAGWTTPSGRRGSGAGGVGVRWCRGLGVHLGGGEVMAEGFGGASLGEGDTSLEGEEALPERSSGVTDLFCLWELSERSLH
ncbi:hypothetical protein ANANG_G00276400, partial [Anguilla anguilla]